MQTFNASGYTKCHRSWQRAPDYQNFMRGAAATYYPLHTMQNASALGTTVLTAGTMYTRLFTSANRDLVIDQLAIEVTALVAASTVGLGIYATDNDESHPQRGQLIASVNVASTALGVSSGAVSLTLERGKIYIAAVLSAFGPTIRGASVANMGCVLSDAGAVMQYLGGQNFTGFTYAGVMPAMINSAAGATTGLQLLDFIASLGNSPIIFGRVST